jgi:hypothetical protein
MRNAEFSYVIRLLTFFSVFSVISVVNQVNLSKIMIRRRDGDDWLLITQADHARLAGKLAEQFGVAEFAPPAPFGPVVSAIAMHDSGWPPYDLQLSLNPQGLPRHAFEMPLATSLTIWSGSAAQACAAGPYCGLLVSLHSLALSNYARLDPENRRELFLLNRFQHQQIELQEILRKSLGLATDQPLRFGLAEPGRSPEEDLLLFNFRLLGALDAISLVLCFAEMVISQPILLHPRPGAATVGLNLQLDWGGELAIDPWPFQNERIEISVPAKRVAGKAFAGEGEFRKACEIAATESIVLKLQKTPKLD